MKSNRSKYSRKPGRRAVHLHNNRNIVEAACDAWLANRGLHVGGMREIINRAAKGAGL